jgi:hypothetical protein
MSSSEIARDDFLARLAGACTGLSSTSGALGSVGVKIGRLAVDSDEGEGFFGADPKKDKSELCLLINGKPGIFLAK